MVFFPSLLKRQTYPNRAGKDSPPGAAESGFYPPPTLPKPSYPQSDPVTSSRKPPCFSSGLRQEETVSHRNGAGLGDVWAWEGRPSSAELCVASGRKNALLSHQDVNYREPLLSSTGRTSKPQDGDGRTECWGV
ncbi:hypothetical protein IRJ41_010297 [Triplophysa rosa]|uniref:Uncharacterized protein n=1 Tax=Triplophysa rosa TaxID=992332 RepID=A0A9W7WWB9_TRIRA|nr:hypothetical protein IRJ41_010297 [Triplophysa rosa]